MQVCQPRALLKYRVLVGTDPFGLYDNRLRIHFDRQKTEQTDNSGGTGSGTTSATQSGVSLKGAWSGREGLPTQESIL